MKRNKIIIPILFFLLLICVTPVYASSGKIHSLSLSTLSVTRNSQETFHWLMRNNKLSGYSNLEKDQHAYYSEAITATQFETLLNNAFEDSKDNDLNFFYFTGHTIFERIDPISGPLGINLNVSTKDYYAFNALARKLNSYKGKMVVILDTCGSEAFITDGINSLSNTSRISVICSCGYLEESEFGYGYLNPYLFFNGYRYNTFTYALGKGLGFFNQSKSLLADSNNDGSVSIQELFQYTRNNTNSLKEMNVRMFSQNASANIFSYGAKGISIKLSKTSVSLYKGKSKQLRATVTGTNKKPSWTSSNKSVATVNSNGKITAKKRGSTTITCKIGNKKATCKVTVKNPVKTKNSLKLNKSKISMYITESTKIKATASGNSKKVTWKSSNTKVATVKNGTVTAKKAGTVTITAICNGIKKTCRVTVKGDWYQKVLRSSASYKIKGAFDKKTYTISRKNFNEYRLFDINKDGVKELMLYKRPAAAIFTFYKGKVVPLAYSNFTRSICLKGKYFTMVHGTSSENTCYVFTLKNGKLQKVGEYFHTTSSAYPVPVYEINGKKCSKTVFFKAYDKYMKNATYL